MDGQNENKQNNLNTNQNLENKILKDRINNHRRIDSTNNIPKRNNQLNNELPEIEMNNSNNIEGSNNLTKKNNGLSNNKHDLDSQIELEDNNGTLTSKEDIPDGLRTPNISLPRRNILNKDNNGNNLNDPTQKKLDRINNQNKQQNSDNNKNNDTKKNNENKNEQPKTNQQSPNNPNQNKPKTKGSASTSSNNKKSNIVSNIKKVNQVKNEIGEKIDEGENASDAINEVVQEHAKQVVKTKIKEKMIQLFMKVILPILPYILVFLLVFFIVLVVIFMIFGILDDEDNVIYTIKLNYCEYVNLKWGEGLEENKTITSNEYIEYKINTSDFKDIDNKAALKALIIVYRTNLYANSDNLDSNVCYFDVEEEYEEIENELLDEAMEETDNKVFSSSETSLSTIDIDDNFTYLKIEDDDYRLYQDKMSYNKNWIDSHIDSSNITDDSKDVFKRSFSPFAAWYLAEVNNFHYQSLIYHFVTPASSKGNIYKAVKLNGSDSEEYGNMCSDISLATTSLERQEFIDKVNSYNSSYSAYSVFKTNAGKIYDIATNNNFNPEMVVIRAISEGFSPGGSTYNYWGIGCANGKKCSKSYSSFDQGVLEYINTVKKINSVSLFQMQYKYSYLGSNWFNPGGSGQGGCYYFPYLRKYLSESRANEVADACASGKTCSGSSCLATTEEDQTAYTRYQIESMLNTRGNVFDITADNCSEEGDTVDGNGISDLGKAVADYAVKTYDSYQYNQPNRDQDGFVDCSSLVYRAYRHFNVKIYDSGNSAAEIYRWCEKNGKTISGSNLAPGDLIFYNSGSHRNSSHYQGIGHVEMYIGNGQKFGAHKHNSSNPSADVSVKTYTNDGNLFCRPTK